MLIISADIYYPSTSLHLTTTSLVPVTVLSWTISWQYPLTKVTIHSETCSWLQTDDWMISKNEYLIVSLSFVTFHCSKKIKTSSLMWLMKPGMFWPHHLLLAHCPMGFLILWGPTNWSSFIPLYLPGSHLPQGPCTCYISCLGPSSSFYLVSS